MRIVLVIMLVNIRILSAINGALSIVNLNY